MLSRHPLEAVIGVRAGVLWLLARLALPLVSRGDAVVLHPKASLLLVAAVGALSWLDLRRRNQDLLLANLGTPRWMLHLLGFGPALGLECLVAVIGRS